MYKKVCHDRFPHTAMDASEKPKWTEQRVFVQNWVRSNDAENIIGIIY